MGSLEEIDIVIAGGGICGLATALALHRKGIESVVLEKSNSLRADGGGICILTNGWRALEQLGVASDLRQTAVPLEPVWAGTEGEQRFLKRSDLVGTLAQSLPHGAIRFGCQVLSIELDPLTSYPIIQLHDGSQIKAKILIGCDGAHSAVADFLGVKPPKVYCLHTVRSFTYYPDGHGYGAQLLQVSREKYSFGRFPIDDKTLYWFVGRRGYPPESTIFKDPEFVIKYTLESMKGCPEELVDMIERSDPENTTLTHIRYHAPLDLLLGKLRKATVTLAGDAMHTMGPWITQGGSAALEDAIVLARILAKKRHRIDFEVEGRQVKVTQSVIGEALDEYIKERRMRLLKLSLQTHLRGLVAQSSSPLMKYAITMLMNFIFKEKTAHARYDCGEL